MKYVILACRLLLGLLFFASGLMNVLHLLKAPANQPPSDALTFEMILMHSGWMTFVAILMLIAGLLLLVGRFVPLALTLLAPLLVNILLFHLLLQGGHNILPGLIGTVFEVVLILAYWRSFAPLFLPEPKIQPKLDTPKL